MTTTAQAITFTSAERQAAEAAAVQYALAAPHVGKLLKTSPDRKQKFTGPTADDVLKAHGIGEKYRRGNVTWSHVVGEVVRIVNERQSNGRRPMSAYMVGKARKMRSDGASYPAIAKAVGCHHTTVMRQLR